MKKKQAELIIKQLHAIVELLSIIAVKNNSFYAGQISKIARGEFNVSDQFLNKKNKESK